MKNGLHFPHLLRPSNHRRRYEAIAFHISLALQCVWFSRCRGQENGFVVVFWHRETESTSFRRFGEYTQLYTASHQSYKSSHVVRFDDEIRNWWLAKLRRISPLKWSEPTEKRNCVVLATSACFFVFYFYGIDMVRVSMWRRWQTPFCKILHALHLVATTLCRPFTAYVQLHAHTILCAWCYEALLLLYFLYFCNNSSIHRHRRLSHLWHWHVTRSEWVAATVIATLYSRHPFV